MGIGPNWSTSAVDNPTQGNPDPRKFKIWRTEYFSPYLIVEVVYPDCTNYEGRKILVFRDVTLQQLLAQGAIDPHFNESGVSPIARFEPTDDGWRWACNFAEDAP